MTKRVLAVVEGGFPDIRVEKTMSGLESLGWKTWIMARSGAPGEGPWAGKVLPLTPPPWPRRLDSLLDLAPLVPAPMLPAPGMQRQVERAIDACRPDLLYWNDQLRAHVGLAAARRRGVPFVLDLHENYPYNMWSTERDLRARSRRYHLNDWFRHERLVCQGAALVVTSVEEMNERLNGMHFLPHEKMHVFLNAEDPAAWDETPRLPTAMDDLHDKDALLYAGSCSVHRGLDVVARAVGLLRDAWPSLRLVIVGAGKGLERVEALRQDLGLADRILLQGRRPFAEMASWMRPALAGAIPHYRYGQTDNTLPHKLFQYWSLRIPVLVSNCPCLARMATESGGGVVFRSGDAASAARALERLRDPAAREAMGAAGRAACESRWSLRRQQEGLAEALERACVAS